MIGAIVFKLRAEETAPLPTINGRLMHAAFFRLLESASPEASQYLHDRVRLKPFTVSMLSLSEWKRGKYMSYHEVPKGTVFYWRVTALWEDVLKLILATPKGYHVQAGKLPLTVEEVIADPDVCSRSGFVEENDLMARAFTAEGIRNITFHFRSPTSFRIDNVDYAFPEPPLLWGSLVDKWIASGCPLEVKKSSIKDAASAIRLTKWSGRSRTIYFGHDRGVLTFTGNFTFDLSELALDWRQMYLLLAQFATFSGVGRLCGQGLGEVDISYD